MNQKTLSSLITWPQGDAAQRLVESLSQLELHMANLAALGGKQNDPRAANSELARLRAENEALHKRRVQAVERLDALIENLSPLLENAEPSTSSHGQEAAA